MTLPRMLLVLLAALLVAACGPSDDDTSEPKEQSASSETSTATVEEEDLEDGDVGTEELELEEIDDSGVAGTVTVRPTEGESVEIAVTLTSGGDETRALQATRGSCEDAADPGAVDEVVDSVAGGYTLLPIEDGASKEEVKLPSQIVNEGTYALLVYEGDDVESDPAACVAIKVE